MKIPDGQSIRKINTKKWKYQSSRDHTRAQFNPRLATSLNHWWRGHVTRVPNLYKQRHPFISFPLCNRTPPPLQSVRSFSFSSSLTRRRRDIVCYQIARYPQLLDLELRACSAGGHTRLHPSPPAFAYTPESSWWRPASRRT